jgi:hypothetical protein
MKGRGRGSPDIPEILRSVGGAFERIEAVPPTLWA